MLHLMLHQAPMVDELFRSFTEVKVVKPQCKNTKKYYLKKHTKSIKSKVTQNSIILYELGYRPIIGL